MSNLRPFIGLASRIFNGSETICSFCFNKGLLKPVKSDLFNLVPFLRLHTTPRMSSEEGRARRKAAKEFLKMDKGLKGANSPLMDTYIAGYSKDIFPTVNLPDTLFNGVPFKDIPIANVKITRNNTIISLSHQGDVKLIRSCGLEGFKNCRKGTNLAAQTTGLSFGLRAIKKGFKDIRLILKGVGPGRTGIIKGLQLSGLNVISLTDCTKCSTSQKPKKERRI